MTRIHAIGDSWTCREEDTGLDRGWQAFALPPDCRHGVSGSTARQWALDEEKILTSALAAMQPGDTVIVSLIGNDLRHAQADGDGFTFFKVAEAAGSLISVVQTLLQHSVHPVILLYADPHRGRNDETKRGVAMTRRLLRSLAHLNGCTTLDTATILQDKHFLPGPGIHPTEAGHRAIANHILKHGDTL